MNTTNEQELISALADGELQGQELAEAIRLATQDDGARHDWHAIHLVGEVLRTGKAVPGTAPEIFLGKLQQRLAAEAATRPVARAAVVPVVAGRPAANDQRWKLAAGFASLAAVAAIGWNLVGSVTPATQQPQLAAAPAAVIPVAAMQQQGTMIRDPRLDQFLAAHRQFGGATVLQTSSGFLRNATFEGTGR